MTDNWWAQWWVCSSKHFDCSTAVVATINSSRRIVVFGIGRINECHEIMVAFVGVGLSCCIECYEIMVAFVGVGLSCCIECHATKITLNLFAFQRPSRHRVAVITKNYGAYDFHASVVLTDCVEFDLLQPKYMQNVPKSTPGSKKPGRTFMLPIIALFHVLSVLLMSEFVCVASEPYLVVVLTTRSYSVRGTLQWLAAFQWSRTASDDNCALLVSQPLPVWLQ